MDFMTPSFPYTSVYQTLCSGLRSYLDPRIAVIGGEVLYMDVQTLQRVVSPSVTLVIQSVNQLPLEMGTEAWAFHIIAYLKGSSFEQRSVLKGVVTRWMTTINYTVPVPSGDPFHCAYYSFSHITDIPIVSMRSDSFWYAVAHGTVVVYR